MLCEQCTLWVLKRMCVQGVSAFAASRTFSLIASGGLERNVLLWHPAAPRSLVGSLIGHETAVTHLALDDRHSQASHDAFLNVSLLLLLLLPPPTCCRQLECPGACISHACGCHGQAA